MNVDSSGTVSDIDVSGFSTTITNIKKSGKVTNEFSSFTSANYGLQVNAICRTNNLPMIGDKTFEYHSLISYDLVISRMYGE